MMNTQNLEKIIGLNGSRRRRASAKNLQSFDEAWLWLAGQRRR